MDIREVLGKPGNGSRGIDDMFADLRKECGEEHGGRGKNAVSDLGEEQQSHADDVG